jgi:hypothetical protein
MSFDPGGDYPLARVIQARYAPVGKPSPEAVDHPVDKLFVGGRNAVITQSGGHWWGIDQPLDQARNTVEQHNRQALAGLTAKKPMADGCSNYQY